MCSAGHKDRWGDGDGVLVNTGDIHDWQPTRYRAMDNA